MKATFRPPPKEEDESDESSRFWGSWRGGREGKKDLYLYGLENGYLLFKNKAGSAVRCPVAFRR